MLRGVWCGDGGCDKNGLGGNHIAGLSPLGARCCSVRGSIALQHVKQHLGVPEHAVAASVRSSGGHQRHTHLRGIAMITSEFMTDACRAQAMLCIHSCNRKLSVLSFVDTLQTLQKLPLHELILVGSTFLCLPLRAHPVSCVCCCLCHAFDRRCASVQ